MAKVVYSATHRGNFVVSLEEVFASFVNIAQVTDSTATVGNDQQDPKFLFNYVLSDGTSNNAKVHSFTLALSPDFFVNPQPFVIYDADPDGNGFVDAGLLGSLHGNGDNRMELLFAGNDTIVDNGSMGRTHNGYGGNDTITASSTKSRNRPGKL